MEPRRRASHCDLPSKAEPSSDDEGGVGEVVGRNARNQSDAATASNSFTRSNELLRLDDTSENPTVKRHRSVAFQLLEAALYQWITECKNQVNMSGDLINEKATECFHASIRMPLQSNFRVAGSKSSSIDTTSGRIVALARAGQ